MSRTGRPDVVVVGGGRFGRLAVERLGKRVALVIEPEPAPELTGMGAEVLRGEGVEMAARTIRKKNPPSWIVPTLPRHFLAEWLMLELAHLHPAPVELPSGCLPEAPSIHNGGAGQAYLSLADFLCPDDCPEPAEICTVTGKPRGIPLHGRLAAIRVPGWNTGVLASRQLAPGVGGLLTSELLGFKDRVAAKGGCWLLGTACKCHGVWQAIRFS